MDIVSFTQTRCPELADFLTGVAHARFDFEGDYPLSHSSYNHEHLWALEYWADRHQWIDLEYRTDFARHIFDSWRSSLRGYAPYQDKGYRLYLYEDLAPTVSVVAETPVGFPYGGEPVFVVEPQDIMALYVGRSWRDNWLDEEPSDKGPPIKFDDILSAIERNKGSIGKPAAETLGLKVGELRKLIINMGLGREANRLRKRFKRRPANFTNDPEYVHSWKIYESLLPPRY